jgi:hypothetical protein
MPWTSLVLQLGAAVPFLAGFVIVSYVLIIAIASMVAIWHPTASRRAAALTVLALMLRAKRRQGSEDREPP